MWVGLEGRDKTFTLADWKKDDPDKVLDKYEQYVQ